MAMGKAEHNRRGAEKMERNAEGYWSLVPKVGLWERKASAKLRFGGRAVDAGRCAFRV